MQSQQDNYILFTPSLLPTMTSVDIHEYAKDQENSKIQLDPRDANTPDKWIERHPELIRLTGTRSPSSIHRTDPL